MTYESVLIRERKVYHAMVADWLIAHVGERTEELTGLIAGHLEKAGRNHEALGYLRRAAKAAASKYANDEAADFYARALALTPDENLEGRYALLIGQERVLSLQGNRSAQQGTIASLQALAHALTDEHKGVEVLLRRAWFAYWTGDYPKAQEAAYEAVALAKMIGDQRLTGQASYTSAWAYLQTGDFDFERFVIQGCIVLLLVVGDALGHFRYYRNLGGIVVGPEWGKTGRCCV